MRLFICEYLVHRIVVLDSSDLILVQHGLEGATGLYLNRYMLHLGRCDGDGRFADPSTTFHFIVVLQLIGSPLVVRGAGSALRVLRRDGSFLGELVATVVRR